MKNVKNYVEEAETYILNDEHTHQEVVGLNSSLKKHTSNPKMQLRTRGGFFELEVKVALGFH